MTYVAIFGRIVIGARTLGNFKVREYNTFVYLDVKKTGSSFIAEFLRRFSKEKQIRYRGHAGMPADADRSKFYFISVRNPLDQYISLYSFGCDARGQLAQRLRKYSKDDLYDRTWRGFESWLDFVLDPENALVLEPGYNRLASARVSEILGFQSYRVLALSLPGAKKLLMGCESTTALDAVYEQHKLPEWTIKTESLRSDLKKLVLLKLPDRFRDLHKAASFIETEKPINASKRVDGFDTGQKLNKALQRRLEEREWFLHKHFNY